MNKFKHKVECIEDVVMKDSDAIAFTKGEVYNANLDGHYINIINNDGEVHCVGTRSDDDKFFYKHFMRAW